MRGQTRGEAVSRPSPSIVRRKRFSGVKNAACEDCRYRAGDRPPSVKQGACDTIRAMETTLPFTLVDRLADTHRLKRDDYERIIAGFTPALAAHASARAQAETRRHYGTDIFTRGLIEFTSVCKNDCYYCGLRCSNRTAERYRLTPDQILQCADAGHFFGYRTFVLQGGEDPFYTDEVLCDVVTRIKATHSCRWSMRCCAWAAAAHLDCAAIRCPQKPCSAATSVLVRRRIVACATTAPGITHAELIVRCPSDLEDIEAS